VDFSKQAFDGPQQPADFDSWLAEIQRWRDEQRLRIGYQGADYDRPELEWTRRNFVHALMPVEDRYFYDPSSGQYTVDRYLDDLEQRFGGIDSVLIWPSYPNIGIDDRNQHDWLRDMPGGLEGLRCAVDDFHRRDVRVLLPAMPWDRGTRDESTDYWQLVAETLAETGADGLMGDTMAGIPYAFRRASDQTGHVAALEPELGLAGEEALSWTTMTWGYWGDTLPFVPSVSKYKWLEPRHMVHLCSRWDRDRLDAMQVAFFNGIGYIAWENIWGIWNQLTPRAADFLRRIASIACRYAHLLSSPYWEPHTPTLQSGVFASRFVLERQTLWTVVNRNEYAVRGDQIRIQRDPDVTYYDLWHGTSLAPEVSGEAATLHFPLDARGFGAILASPAPIDLPEGATPGHEIAHDWRVLPQQCVEIPRAEPPPAAPPGMILIPAARFDFKVSGVEIEGGNAIGVDVQYPWEDSPRRHHRQTLDIPAFYIDRYPVTNAQFGEFLEATRYHPKDDYHFLKDWIGGRYPAGWENRPVTWVALEDARAFATWANKRLPHEWEWQYAAQGTDGRLYPWGNAWNIHAVPPGNKGRRLSEPANVDAHPEGASPFGVMAMVGHIWQWTDEYQDLHTRAAVLRGGSSYLPQGSSWYFPQAYELNVHGKYLLMAPGRDRAGTIGFRCVCDTGSA